MTGLIVLEFVRIAPAPDIGWSWWWPKTFVLPFSLDCRECAGDSFSGDIVDLSGLRLLMVECDEDIPVLLCIEEDELLVREWVWDSGDIIDVIFAFDSCCVWCIFVFMANLFYVNAYNSAKRVQVGHKV